MIAAVVPAGGHSTRMGTPKLALPLGDRPVIAHVVAALRAGGADRVLVVVGPHVPELVPLAEAAGADVHLLSEPTADMRATVEHGLRWLEAHDQPGPDDAWLLAPGDCPTLDPAIVRQVCAAYAERPDRGVVVPVCDGRRGHPVLIAWRLVPELRGFPAGQGIDAFRRTHQADTLEVPVIGGLPHDLDTPEDYRAVAARWAGPAG